MKLFNKLFILIVFGCLLLTGCRVKTFYKTQSYTWEEDTFYQKEGGLQASTPSANTLVSNYPDSEYESGEWHLTRDLSQFATYTAPTRIEEAIYNLSLEECINAVEADSTLRTGKNWAGVWTRDVSYSILLSMSHLQTNAAKYSLMHKVGPTGKIIEDTGTGGSWPCSTDRIVWAVAAWEIYKVTGDSLWLETIYPIIKRTIEDDLLVAFDTRTGMMKGESTFLDWREQEYPLWMKPVDIYNSENLGTECLHYQALKILSAMEGILGSREDAERYDSFAEKIKEGINSYLWMEDKGYYGQYLYGRHNLILSPRSETLGEALAILFGVASAKQSASIVANMPQQVFGTSCFFPQIAGIPPYHNDAMWPFVQSFWMKANAKAGNEKGVLHSISSIYRMAALFLTNKENMVIGNGRWQGTEINSSNMLWSLSGNLSIVYSILFGMQYETSGIRFTPLVPKSMGGERMLKSFRYRDAEYDIELSGYGCGIKSFSLDGEKTDAFIPADLTGKHTIKIVLDGKSGSSKINIVTNAYSPETPICIVSDSVLNWSFVEGVGQYRIICDGQEIATTADNFFTMEKEGQYQVIALGNNGYESFASEPVDFSKTIHLIDISKFAKSSVAPYKSVNGSGYVYLTKTENTTVSIPIEIAQDGLYAMDILYANANGPINTDNKCALRTLWVDGERVGAIVMPQCGVDAFHTWNYSNPYLLNLSAGLHEFKLTFEPENENMNIDVNSAAINKLRLIKKNTHETKH